MASKTQQKSKKKKKLTEEEKKALKLEKQHKILRDHIEREDNFTRLSHNRSGKSFFKTVEKYKTNSLSVERCAAIQQLHHQIANTDNKVEKLETDRDNLLDHLTRAHDAQAELIKYITDLFHLFQNALQNLFEINRKNLVDDFYAQKIVWERFYYEGKRSFENYAHQLVSALKVSLENQTEKLKDDKIAIRAGSVIFCENIYRKQPEFDEKIIKELDDIYKAFIWMWPKERNERYQVTLKEYLEIQAEIEELESAAHKAEYEAFRLENLWRDKQVEWTKEVSLLANYCDFLERSLLNLRIIERNAQNQENDKLKALSNISLKVSKHLQRNLKTLENISMLFKICGKYETLQDRTRFFDQSDDDSNSFNNFKSFNKNLCQKSLNFSFQSSSILTDPTIYDKNSSCFHEKKLKCGATNNQCCLKSLMNSNNNEIDGHKGIVNAENSSESNPLKFLQIYSSPDFNAYYLTDNQYNEDENILSTKYPSHVSSRLPDKPRVNELIVDQFYRKLSIVKTDCLVLRRYKEEMTKTNEQLKKLLAVNKHQFGVQQNLRKLKLNASTSIGNVCQFSHQIPQIQEELIIRKCRSMHLKVNDQNKAV